MPDAIANTVSSEHYGEMPDGRGVMIYTLRNKNGVVAKVTEYGAILVGVKVPDKHGTVADLTHGYGTLDGWLSNTSCFGATVGRYGNRIARGQFSIDGEHYQLATNNAPGGIPCHLHGGEVGFDQVLWSGKAFHGDGFSGVTLSYVSQDGEEGYPGTLRCEVTYTLNDDNELIWKATAAVDDKPTPVNLIHHSYWNLSGNPMSSIDNHFLTLHANEFLVTDIGLIPTGERAPVKGTPFDFTSATAIGDRINDKHAALDFAGGYDHCWVLPELAEGQKLQSAAILHDTKTGRTMEILTNQPGIQFYTSNFLDGTQVGKGGQKYPWRSAACLETQAFPDSPNQPQFPNCILRPGQTYQHTMVHCFSW